MEEPPSLPSADAVCDGGDLDCGSGLLLIIRSAMEPVASGGVLEVRSREVSVREDLPAWCRMVGHTFLGASAADEATTRYLIRKKGPDEQLEKDLETARDQGWRVRVRWKEGMQARAFVRNHAFTVGQPASFDTEDAAPSALEYLLSALAGCLAVGLQWRISRRRATVRNLEVSLHARAGDILVFLGVEREGNPGLDRITGQVFLDCDLGGDEVQELWDETLRCSPVAQTLLRGAALQVEMRNL